MKKSVLTLAILLASMSVNATSYKQPNAEASAVAAAQSNLQNSNKSSNTNNLSNRNNLSNLNNLNNRSSNTNNLSNSNTNNLSNLNNLSNRSSNSNKLSTGDSTAINANHLSTGDSISKSVNTLSTGAATSGDSISSVKESNNNANIGASNSIIFEAEKNTPDLSLSNVQPTIPCAVPINASGVGAAFGLGFGTAYIDKACEERELIRLGLASGDSNTNSLANVVLQKRLAEILKPEAKEENTKSNYEDIMGW